MPLRKLVLLLLASIMLAGCSRLTFVKPKIERKDGEQIAPTYEISDSPATERRMKEQQRLSLAAQRLRSGDLDTAEREAEAILKSNPDSVDAVTIMAIVQDQRGNKDAAGKYYKRATSLAPDKGSVQNNYGAWLCANGFAAESLVWFDRALQDKRYASPASALANAGDCALKVGQYERASRDLRQALALDPANAVALEGMAQSEFRDGRYFEARAFAERRLAAAPANASVLKLGARIEERLGDSAAASRYLQRLRAEFPDEAVGFSTGGNAGQ